MIEQRMISVLVPYENGAKLSEEYRHADLKKKRALMRQIGRYSVSLYPYQVKKLDELGALTLIGEQLLELDGRYYNDKLGVIFNSEAEL